jgi:3-oxoacyl-[acyl-carrier protein] reductase
MNTLPGMPLALVTGAGRRRGIGAAICRALAATGYDIFFTHWQSYDQIMPWGADADGPAALEEELRATGIRCASMDVDLSLPESPMRVLDAAQASGALTVLVNNAAYSTQTNVDTLDAASLDAHYAVNVRAAALLSVEFARRFHGENGRIINLTSGQSLGPMPDELAYAMSKGAIETFTRSLAPAIMARGITINAVNPGPTDTGWMNDEVKMALLPRFPGGRLGQPDDVARLITFLASRAADWITGQVIHSEGGFVR